MDSLAAFQRPPQDPWAESWGPGMGRMRVPRQEKHQGPWAPYLRGDHEMQSSRGDGETAGANHTVEQRLLLQFRPTHVGQHGVTTDTKC